MSLHRQVQDKKLKLIKNQAPKEVPPPLGESTVGMDWDSHIKKGHKIKSFTTIQDRSDGQKQAAISTPKPGQVYVPMREDRFGYHYIWILCINEKTGHIILQINTGGVDFVHWDVPEE